MSQEQKTPLSRTLSLFVDGMIRKEIEKTGRALPCQVVAVDASGTVVTVSFQISGVQMPQVQMPVGMAEYIRLPIQAKSLGVCFPVDTYIGEVTGLGTGTASLSRRGNLSTLVFFPTGNINLAATDDANALVMYGPNGVILRDSGSKSVVTLTPANIDVNAQDNFTAEAGTEVQFTVGSVTFTMNGSQIQMSAGGVTATLSSAGFIVSGLLQGANVTTAGALTAATATIGGEAFATHKHSGVTTGAGNTGNPI